MYKCQNIKWIYIVLFRNIFGLYLQQMEKASAPEPNQPTKGIPNFWLHLLKNVDHICDMIQEHDEPILKHLIDITCDVQTNPDVRFCKH